MNTKHKPHISQQLTNKQQMTGNNRQQNHGVIHRKTRIFDAYKSWQIIIIPATESSFQG